MRAELKLSAKKIIKKGYGTYITWIGWCEKCKRFRVHTEPMYISFGSPTCSEGHYSDGRLTGKKLLRRLELKKK